MTIEKKCLVMFSGGLDSVCAAHMLKAQGFEVVAVHYILPFIAGIGRAHSFVKEAAASIGIELRIIEEGEEYLTMVRNPLYGFGSNANPCIDCRIHRLVKTRILMEQENFLFVATGEVVGQRPMSQKKPTMRLVEKKSGLEGRLLRPLSAKIVAPTIAEQEGIVDRDKLYNWNGRGRKEQLAYALKHGLVHGSPGGGCFLTEPECLTRFSYLNTLAKPYTLTDFRLMYWGRWFRISPTALFIVGRNADENDALGKIGEATDVRMTVVDYNGPLGLCRGDFTDEDLMLAGSILTRYTRMRFESKVPVHYALESIEKTFDVTPGDDALLNTYRIH